MNVKDFQAGMKGFCPVCGEKVQIPLESTRPSSRRRRATQNPAVESRLDATPTEQPIEAASETSSSSAATVFDPISPPFDAPNVVWYVHTPAGEQRGPVRPAVVQAWLGEGKITADCLVWREGWAEWQVAGQVFEQLATMPSPAELEIIPHHAVASSLNDRVSASHVPPRKTQLLALGALVAIVAILAIVFFVIWMAK